MRLNIHLRSLIFTAREEAFYYGFDFWIMHDTGVFYLRGSLEHPDIDYSGFVVGEKVCTVSPDECIKWEGPWEDQSYDPEKILEKGVDPGSTP